MLLQYRATRHLKSAEKSVFVTTEFIKRGEGPFSFFLAKHNQAFGEWVAVGVIVNMQNS